MSVNCAYGYDLYLCCVCVWSQAQNLVASASPWLMENTLHLSTASLSKRDRFPSPWKRRVNSWSSQVGSTHPRLKSKSPSLSLSGPMERFLSAQRETIVFNFKWGRNLFVIFLNICIIISGSNLYISNVSVNIFEVFVWNISVNIFEAICLIMFARHQAGDQWRHFAGYNKWRRWWNHILTGETSSLGTYNQT